LFYSLDGPPVVDFEIAVNPAPAYDCVQSFHAPIPLDQRPIPLRVPAGNDHIEATIEPPTQPFADWRQLVTIGPRTPMVVVPVSR